MSERSEKGDDKRAKGGNGYTARRWREWWTFTCDARTCKVDSDDRATIERHVLVAHGKVQGGAGASEDGGGEG